MTQRAGLLIGSMLIALSLVATGASIVALVVASRMPSHTDERRAEELTRLYNQEYLEWPSERLEPVKNEILSLRTSKWRLYTLGLSICLAAPILLVGILRFRLWDVRNLRTVHTPRTRLGLLGIASIAWLALLPATQLQIGDEFAMDDFTPFTDTGHGMFLVFGPPLFATIWIGTIVVGRFIVLRNVLLPADLWCWDGTRRRRSLVWTVFYGLLSALLIALVGFSTFTFPWSLPTWILGLYVILSTRAALVNCSQ